MKQCAKRKLGLDFDSKEWHKINLDEYYQKHYLQIINQGPVGFISKIVHWSMEHLPYSVTRLRMNPQVILELGAGHGQHLQFVKKSYSEYLMTDLRPENIPVQLARGGIKIYNESVDAHKLPFPDDRFDRVIATCLLIHLQDPQKALEEWKRVLKNDGTLTIYIPCETGLLLRIAQQLSTRRSQRKLGIDAEYLHRIEHPYSYLYLKSMIQHVFNENLFIRKFPFVFGSWNFNLWSVISIKNKKQELKMSKISE